ncbi:MAG: hypothetical protein AVDCRST_MAG02-1487, partial [uncultured Rubrobacteraceae bacterium]
WTRSAASTGCATTPSIPQPLGGCGTSRSICSPPHARRRRPSVAATLEVGGCEDERRRTSGLTREEYRPRRRVLG